MRTKPEAIFFDVGNTLLFPNWSRILGPLTERGVLPTHEQLRTVECQTKNEFDRLMEHGDKPDQGFWHMFYTRLADLLEVEDEVLVNALTEATRSSANWDRLRTGTREKLEEIASCCQIAVISNADGKIAQMLEQCGIHGCFVSITDSGILGYEKPHPAIFAAALKSLNLEPERALYVGDFYSVDYVGARQAGMGAMLFDVAGAYRERDLPRVESLDELHQMLSATKSV